MHELHVAAPHPGRGGFYHQKNMLEKCRIQASYGGDMLFLAADDQLLFGMRDSIPRLKNLRLSQRSISQSYEVHERSAAI